MTTIYVDSRKTVARTATLYSKTNSLSVAYNGNRLILTTWSCGLPAAPPASPTKPFSVDHTLGQLSPRAQFVKMNCTTRYTCAAPRWPTPAECWPGAQLP